MVLFPFFLSDTFSIFLLTTRIVISHMCHTCNPMYLNDWDGTSDDDICSGVSGFDHVFLQIIEVIINFGFVRIIIPLIKEIPV